MNKILIGSTLIITGLFLIFTSSQLYESHQKVEFLENALGVKSLEYEWLSEITDSVLYDCDITKEFEAIKEMQKKLAEDST